MLESNSEIALTRAALEQLDQLPGISVSSDLEPTGDRQRFDGTVCVETSDVSATYGLWVKPRLRADSVGVAALAVRALAAPDGGVLPTLLITEHVPPTLAERLVRRGIQFVDSAGNMSIRERGLHLYVTGRRPQMRLGADRDSQLTPARLRVLFSLLADRALRGADLRTIAKGAGVSLGTVSTALRALRARGLVTGPRTQPRFRDYAAVLRVWDQGYAERLRPSLQPRRFALPSGRSLTDLPELIAELPGAPAVIGGELAAAMREHGLRPATATLYTEHPPTSFGGIDSSTSTPEAVGSMREMSDITRVLWPASPRRSGSTSHPHPVPPIRYMGHPLRGSEAVPTPPSPLQLLVGNPGFRSTQLESRNPASVPSAGDASNRQGASHARNR